MALHIPIAVEPLGPSVAERPGKEPLTFGLPFPKGVLHRDADIRLVDAQGIAVPVQTRVTDRWADGSIRWLLIDFQASAGAGGRASYSLQVDGSTPPVSVSPGLAIDSTGRAIIVDSGAAVFIVSSRGPDGTLDGRSVRLQPDHQLIVVDGDGERLPVVVDWMEVEEQGALRSTIRVNGAAKRGARTVLDVVLRLTFFAGLATVRIALTLKNPRRAEHPGGYWQLGDAGSIYLKDVSFVLTIAGADAVTSRCSCEPDQPFQSRSIPLEIYQDSSGGDQWRSPVHVNRKGEIPNSFCGYRLKSGGVEESGARATPVVSINSSGQTISVAVPQFWQTFPKAVEVRDRELTLRLFPSQCGDLHELQGGEQKTHTFFVDVGSSDSGAGPLEWCRSPLIAHADPDWYASAEAIRFLTPATKEGSAEYLALVREGLEGPSSFEAKREAIDEYGWRHFGDIYADHEAVGHKGPQPLVSHYNNQYDPVGGFACWYLRTGDPRWWQLMQDHATHVADIDVYHTTEDKAAYNGGMFWHTVHYQDAGLSTHRSYPHAPRVPGGGPSPEHSYATGLVLHHLLTGDPVSRETAIGLANWILAADDGAQSVFRWLAGGPTGLATSSGSPLYHGPGRGGGNSLGVLIDGHRLTGDARYLQAAEGLIRRCVHPRQDIGALNLGDVERRWFYTMFLQSLGKYLGQKAERGEYDAMFAYARESLMHYARWMAEHERPYLDRPDILEYPNETWAAQDMRKSEVFQFAAFHAEGAERTRFTERADFFFEYSVATLSRMPTHTLARPMVLLLSHGPAHEWFRRNAAQMPDPPSATPWPETWAQRRFEPQKVRAIRRFKAIVMCSAVAALSIAVLWLTR